MGHAAILRYPGLPGLQPPQAQRTPDQIAGQKVLMTGEEKLLDCPALWFGRPDDVLMRFHSHSVFAALTVSGARPCHARLLQCIFRSGPSPRTLRPERFRHRAQHNRVTFLAGNVPACQQEEIQSGRLSNAVPLKYFKEGMIFGCWPDT